MAQSIATTQFQQFVISVVFAFLVFMYFKVFGFNFKSYSAGLVIVGIGGLFFFVYMIWRAITNKKDDSDEENV